jgi:hypothetical protein
VNSAAAKSEAIRRWGSTADVWEHDHEGSGFLVGVWHGSAFTVLARGDTWEQAFQEADAMPM